MAVLYFMNSFLTSGCLSNMRTSLSLLFRYNRCFCELAYLHQLVKSKKSSEHCAAVSIRVKADWRRSSIRRVPSDVIVSVQSGILQQLSALSTDSRIITPCNFELWV